MCFHELFLSGSVCVHTNPVLQFLDVGFLKPELHVHSLYTIKLACIASDH